MTPDGAQDKQLELLFEGYGYRHYRDPASARRDDQIIREGAAESLSSAAEHLARIGQAYARERIPPSTRDNPFPPADRLAEHREILALKDAFSGAAAWIRALPFPDSNEAPASSDVPVLLQFDSKMFAAARKLEDDIELLDLAAWQGSLVARLKAALATVEQVARDRQAHLRTRTIP